MKKYVIDGHNLIPKIPGIHLKDLEDENSLISLIREFCRLSRSSAVLFFDGAPPARQSSKKGGMLQVNFVRKGLSADDAILNYLDANVKEKDRLIVVSSDHRVQSGAKTRHAEVTSSESFSALMQDTFSSPRAVKELKEVAPSPVEVEKWLEEFSNSNRTKKL